MKTTDPGHISEFYEGYNGTCGECALEVAKAAARGDHSSQADMIAITHDMSHRGLLLAANGETTLKNLATEARNLGLKTLLEWDYAEPFPHDWHSVLLQNAGVHPIILQVAQAHNLHDQETGAVDGSNVHYHFIVVLDKKTDGYVVNDGDNPQVSSRYQVYSYPDLSNAVICGLLMLDLETPLPPPPPADDETQEAKDLAALKAQLAAAQAQVQALQAEVAHIRSSVSPALQACAQLLAPFAAAYAEVVQAQKA
jgi:hypothetical protein